MCQSGAAQCSRSAVGSAAEHQTTPYGVPVASRRAPSAGVRVPLSKGQWTLLHQLGEGHYGDVWAATDSHSDRGALKFVTNQPGAAREQLIAESSTGANVPHVIPLLDSGEFGHYLVLAMPLALESLSQYMDRSGPVLAVDEALTILLDIARALAGLASTAEPVVHRDLKPANVLRFEDGWYVADFGISRYVDATTSTHTHKQAGTPPYAAPEQWSGERATPKTDVYALGVMAFQMITGRLPFTGGARELERQHRYVKAPELTVGPTQLRELVAGMLFKAPGSRPTAAKVLDRLSQIARAELPGPGGGAHILAAAVQAKELKGSDAARERRTREQLLQDARRSLLPLVTELGDQIAEIAGRARVGRDPGRPEMLVDMGDGNLDLVVGLFRWDRGWPDLFDVAASSHIAVHLKNEVAGFGGRSHALWFGDLTHPGEYGWYEIAFREKEWHPGISSTMQPYAPVTDDEARRAFMESSGAPEIVWFKELDPADPTEFVDRWLKWLGQALAGTLSAPERFPKEPFDRSWRRPH